MFQQEAYTLVDLKTALSSGQDVAIADLRLLKLPLGECRKILTELQAMLHTGVAPSLRV